MKTKSDLATQIKRLRDVDDRTAPVFGFCIHQTGSGIVDLAIKKGVSPLEKAVAYYSDPDSYFAHYVIDYSGQIVQIADEKEKAQHVGFKDRQLYLSGEWEKKVAPITVQKWKERWPKYKTPAHLFPGNSPNNVYVGAELLPITKNIDAEPMYKGSLYTLAQHQAVVMLAKDVAERWSLPPGWHEGPRLVTHEDLTPVSRSNKNGGWDPGYLKNNPWFDMDWVRTMCGS